MVEQHQRECGIYAFVCLALVGHIHLEACRLTVGNTAHTLLVEFDYGFLYLFSGLVEYLSRQVELGFASRLVGAQGGTAVGAVNETFGIFPIVGFEMPVEEFLVVIHEVVEIL